MFTAGCSELNSASPRWVSDEVQVELPSRAHAWSERRRRVHAARYHCWYELDGATTTFGALPGSLLRFDVTSEDVDEIRDYGGVVHLAAAGNDVFAVASDYKVGYMNASGQIQVLTN